jgi:hypothetical protein
MHRYAHETAIRWGYAVWFTWSLLSFAILYELLH